MHTAYHEESCLSSGELADTASRTARGHDSLRSPVVKNPYAYEVIPPIGRLLDAICAHCAVGGTIRPRNRTLAEWANYASAGHIAPLLDQLACDGRILYDRANGLITRLFDPARDQLIPSGISLEDDTESEDDDTFIVIPQRDRVFAHQDAGYESIPSLDQNTQCMEDSCLTNNSQSLVVRSKIPCGAALIQARDRAAESPDQPFAQLFAELGLTPGKGVIARGLAARDWTESEIRQRWRYDKARIDQSAGRYHAGVFWTAFVAGETAPAESDPERPITPADYAGDSFVRLGSDTSAPECESIGDIARRILPPDATTAAWVFVQTRLARGDSESGALDALAKRVRP